MEREQPPFAKPDKNLSAFDFEAYDKDLPASLDDYDIVIEASKIVEDKLRQFAIEMMNA